MLSSDRIVKNKEFFAYKRLKDSFKSDFLPKLAMVQQQQHQQHVIAANNAKEAEKKQHEEKQNENEEENEEKQVTSNEKSNKTTTKTKLFSLNSQAIHATIEIEPVSASLFFASSSSLLQFCQSKSNPEPDEPIVAKVASPVTEAPVKRTKKSKKKASRENGQLLSDAIEAVASTNPTSSSNSQTWVIQKSNSD